ncbi:MAG: hypothetical protein HN976_31670 [Lentisphaerae bacterium]|nr:hypothetical protein [Lentisphaerota bacterium]MBT7059699.1 hypothetical protein [Lentisphaerota bacterium]
MRKRVTSYPLVWLAACWLLIVAAEASERIDLTELDKMVVEGLNAGNPIAVIGGELRNLPGYSTAYKADGDEINGVHFSRDPGSPCDSYRLIDLGFGDNKTILAQWSPGYGYQPTRLSLYSRLNGRWLRTGVIDSDWKLVPYVTLNARTSPRIVVIEHRRKADALVARLKVLAVEGGKFETVGECEEELLDYAVTNETGDFVVEFSQTPRHIWTSFLGTRLYYQVKIGVGDDGVTFVRTSLNPWIELLDRFAGATLDGDTDLDQYVSKPSLVALLPSQQRWLRILEDDGDVDASIADVVVGYPEGSDRLRRLRLRIENQNGEWRIAAVTQLVPLIE